MYSLIGSFVIMRGREASMHTGMFVHASRFEYGRLRRQMGLCTVQKRFAHISIAHMFVMCASSAKCDSVTRVRQLYV